MTTTWAANGLTATLVGVERGLIRSKTRWVVRFVTTTHTIEMKRDELLKFFSGRLAVAESMKGPNVAVLCRPSAVAENSTTAAVVGELPPDVVVLVCTEPVFEVLTVLSREQSESLEQWLQIGAG